METIFSRYRTGTTSFEGTLRLIRELVESRLRPGIRRVWVEGSNSGRARLVFTIFEDGRDYRMEFLTISGFRQYRPIPLDGDSSDYEREVRLMTEFVDRLATGPLSGVIE